MWTWRACRDVAAALVVLLAAPEARAQEQVRATIVRIDGEDLIVDIGGASAREGLELDVYRQIEVRHPVTRQRLRDRFVIGRVRIAQPGETLSIARLTREPARRVAVGDVVETEVAQPRRPAPAPPIVSPERGTPAQAECPACPACPACPPGRRDPELGEILLAWRATLGKTPEERIRVYETFLQRNPRTRFRPPILTEVAALRAAGIAAAEAAPALSPALARIHRVVDARRGGRLRRARTGEPVEIALAMRPWAKTRSVLLHVRPLEDGEAYETIPMSMDERGHARGRVPDALVRPPGFEYFVEAVPQDGRAVAVVGTEVAPRPVKVTPPPGRPDDRQRSRIRLSSEYVSFEQLSGRDWYFLKDTSRSCRATWWIRRASRTG